MGWQPAWARASAAKSPAGPEPITSGFLRAVEAAFSVLALRDQIAPPTINLDNPSVDTPIDLVPNVAKRMKIDYALSNSFGFGGTNASVVFKTAP